MYKRQELKFPITEKIIDLSAPFEKVNGNSQSTCVGCHIQETRLEDSVYPGDVYESLAFRPTTNQKVNVASFKNEVYKCEFVTNPGYRCQMIFSIYNHGEVLHEDFSTTTFTFLESFGL